jgi:diadenosine tetraphosphate (Ap4A) HIT family hydrolase
MAARCVTCELGQRRRRGEAPIWDHIAATEGWDVAHAFGTDIEGWCVVVARRHITSLAELTDDEAAELGPLVRDLSQALEIVVGSTKTYLAQFAEHPDHRHVHLHVIPRSDELPPDSRGPGVFSRLGLPERDWVPEDRRTELALRIRERLALGGEPGPA